MILNINTLELTQIHAVCGDCLRYEICLCLRKKCLFLEAEAPFFFFFAQSSRRCHNCDSQK